MKDKSEGEIVHKKKAPASRHGEASFSVEDKAIDTLEEQLLKAQQTLDQLQEMKAKLLEEKKRNEDKYKVLELQEENDKLKTELKSYQGEINSLKKVIFSLKEDIEKSTELFQSKVTTSLKKLEEANSQINNLKETAAADNNAIEKIQSEDEIEQPEPTLPELEKEELPKSSVMTDDALKQISQPETEAKRSVDMPAKLENELSPSETEKIQDNKPAESVPASQTEPKPIETPTPPPAAVTPAPVTPEVLAPKPFTSPEVTASSPAPANQEPAPVNPGTTQVPMPPMPVTPAPAPSEPQPVAPAPASPASPTPSTPSPTIPTVSSQPAENIPAEASLDDELSEYEKIKKELDALENGTVFQSSETDANTNSPAAVAPLPQTLTDNKTEVTPPAAAQTPAEPAPEVKAAAPDQPNQTAPQAAEASPAPSTNQEAASDPNLGPVNPNQGQAGTNSPTNIFWNETQGKEETKKPLPKPKRRFLFFYKQKVKKTTNTDEPKTSSDKISSETKEMAKEDIKAGPAGGKMIVKAAGFLMIICIGGVAYQIANAQNLRNLYTNQAKSVHNGGSNTADVPDGFSKEPPEVKYKEAFADIPFDGTVWETYNDTSFGVKLDYPKNTSHKLKASDSNNLWFLRKDGYLLKIDKTETSQGLEQFLANQKTDINYKIENTTWKGYPAVQMTQDEYMPTRGNKYLVKINSDIFEIWYRTYAEGENPDDQKRVAKMLDSFEFTVKPAKTKSKTTDTTASTNE